MIFMIFSKQLFVQVIQTVPKIYISAQIEITLH